MIRLRWPGVAIDPVAALQFTHPRLVRLRGTGPWTFTGAAGSCVAAMQVDGWKADGWGEWTPGLDGAEVSIATNPPPLERLAPDRIPTGAEEVELACGERVWVLPARRAARRLGLRGEDLGPATAYGRAAFDLSDAMDEKRETGDDVLRVCFLALASVHRRLIPEVVIGLGLFSSADIQPLLEAAWRVPKAPAGDGTSSSPPAASSTAANPA